MCGQWRSGTWPSPQTLEMKMAEVCNSYVRQTIPTSRSASQNGKPCRMCRLVPAGDNDGGEQTRAVKRHQEHVFGAVGDTPFCEALRLCAPPPTLRGGRTVLRPTRDILPGYGRPLLRQGFRPTALVSQVNSPLRTPGSTLGEGIWAWGECC